MARETGIDELDAYCEGVASGDIPVCKWVRLAVDRHFRDLEQYGVGREQAVERGAKYYFEPEACLHYVDFFREELKHFDGFFAGQSIEFEPWQYFVWGSPFGWLETERIMDMPIRRFDEIIVLVPKKQGKSLIIAGTVLYLIDWDNYPGAQVYMLANNREQVKGLGYRDAEKMVEGSRALSDRFRVNKSAGDRGIYCDPMNSFVRPQTSKPETSDGLKVHGVANDEIKDWTDFEIYDTMRDGTSTDPNSMVINISTAGENTESLGFERQRYMEKILEQNHSDERTFGVIYGIDPEDRENWDSLDVAKKANPNFGVSVPASYYEQRIKKAKQSKRSKAAYLTKQLNEWGHSTSGWLDLGRWDKGKMGLSVEDVAHLPCIITVDLSSKIDLTEVKLTFFEGYDQETTEFYVISNFYVPKARLDKSDDQHTDAYRQQLSEWEDQGWITISGDETVDYNRIKSDITRWVKSLDVVKLGFDPWNAQQTMNDLQAEGFPADKMVEYVQSGYKNWSEPMKQTEKMIFEGRIHHDGNPVQRWCMGNVGVKEQKSSEAENIRPVKVVEGEKIDGAVTLIMATGTHMYAVEENDSNLSPAARRAMQRKKAKA